MFFGKLFSRFVDVYTLYRMLKNSLNSKIVVVFAGDSHIQFEQRFFEKVLNISPVLKKTMTSDIKQCVHFSTQDWDNVVKASV